jgi:hypothetical protein
MVLDDCDITSYAWIDHESVGLHATGHVQSLELFKTNVVKPSLAALDHELHVLRQGEDITWVFLEDDYVELFDKTMQGYLLATQSMLERGLRALLCERERRLNNGDRVKTIQSARWTLDRGGLQAHFKDLLGIPLTAFDTYDDLDLLQTLGNAIRHGDGTSSQKVYQMCPGLWPHWLSPGSVIEGGPFTIPVPLDAPAFPPFESISLPQALLEQLIQSVIWFWDDIEHMRCNSFSRKHSTVEQKLEEWKIARKQRSSIRVWTP